MAAILAGLVVLGAMDRRIGVYDESIVLQGAVEVMHGAVPHRDFYFNYGPAQLWVLAELFRLFGTTFTVARLYDAAVKALIVLLSGFAMRRLQIPRRLTQLGLTVQVLVLALHSSPLYAVFPVLVLALAGTLILCGEGHDGVRLGGGRLIAAGACAGCAALFRYDCGAYIVVAQGVALLWTGRCEGAEWPSSGRDGLLYASGVALVFLPVAVWAGAAGAWPGFRHDILEFARTTYPRMRNLPWPPLSAGWPHVAELAVYLPPLAGLFGIAFVVQRERGRVPAAVLRLSAMLTLLTLTLFLKALVRTSALHAVMSLLLGVPLALALLVHGRPRLLQCAGLALSLGLLGTTAAGIVGLERKWLVVFPENALALASLHPRPDPDRPSCGTLPRLGVGTMEPDRYNTACFIAAHARPGEPVFVGAGRHDKLFVNDMALYFASARRPGTRWYHFDPGLQTRADIQLQIIGDLDRNGVRWVVQDSSADHVMEPNASSVSSGVFLLDRYLRQAFTPVAQFGPYTIGLRKAP